YARREALLQTRELGPTNGTVTVLGLRQVVDRFTESRLFASTALASGASQRSTDLGTIESMFNDGQGTGIADSLQAMFDSFSALATNPTDSTVRATVLSSAQAFADKVSTTASDLAAFQTEELDKAKGTVSEINQKATNIAELSSRIAIAQSQGQDAADL